MARQTALFDLGPKRFAHGGASARGHRKERRPLIPNKPLHLCMRSSSARAGLSLRQPTHHANLSRLMRHQALRHGVRIQSWVNVGNHLHMVLRFSQREGFQNFLRTFSALSARAITGARKGRPFGRRFWDELAFSRILTSSREVSILEDYLNANALEAQFGAQARAQYLDSLKARSYRRRREP